jgi:hypothetical protein
MAFNQLNAVENCIIHQLSGVHLNNHAWAEPGATSPTRWVFKAPQELGRSVNEVIEEELKNALIRLNPSIKANPRWRAIASHILNVPKWRPFVL